MKLLVKNRKATFEYEVLEKFQSGIILLGSEVKSVINGSCSLAEGYVTIKNDEAFLMQVNINRYQLIDGFLKTINETRERKLLLLKEEIKKINKAVREKGLTVIPLNFYYSDSRKIKLEIAICRGKNKSDKREALKEKQFKIDSKREAKNH
jgi:SsrA-binding protein